MRASFCGSENLAQLSAHAPTEARVHELRDAVEHRLSYPGTEARSRNKARAMQPGAGPGQSRGPGQSQGQGQGPSHAQPGRNRIGPSLFWKVIQCASRSQPGHCRQLLFNWRFVLEVDVWNFVQLSTCCGQGAVSRCFLAFILNHWCFFWSDFEPLDYFCSTLSIFFGVQKTLRRQSCPSSAPKRPAAFRSHISTVIVGVIVAEFPASLFGMLQNSWHF